MIDRLRLTVLFITLILICGCAPVISPALSAKVDPSLTFKEVSQSPNAHKGKLVLWGGEIVQIHPQNGTVLIEVLQRAVGQRGKPDEASPSEGRFFMRSREPLDLYLFKKKEKITVAGEIQGTIQGVPFVIAEEIHFWEKYRGSTAYGPQTYDPFYKPLGTGTSLRY